MFLLQAYFRKGAALAGLSSYEESAYAYLQCLSLDPNVTSARTALAKVSYITYIFYSPEGYHCLHVKILFKKKDQSQYAHIVLVLV